MADIDLDGMSLDELRALRTRVDREISSYAERKRREAMAAVEKAAREHGFALADLTSAKSGRGRRATSVRAAAEAKYANPSDASQTWSGRGRRPRWVAELLDSGRALEDFAI